VAADYLEELLDIADLDGDIDTYIEGDRAHVSIVSESQVLVGSRGEVLDALQELTRLAVMTETGERSRLMLDIAGYREQRRTGVDGARRQRGRRGHRVSRAGTAGADEPL
jgi:spoIIIJ-associated protein